MHRLLFNCTRKHTSHHVCLFWKSAICRWLDKNWDKTNLDAQTAMTSSGFSTYRPSQTLSPFPQKGFSSGTFSSASEKMGSPLVFTMTIQSFSNNPLGDPSISWYRHQDLSLVIPRGSSVLFYPLQLPNRPQMFLRWLAKTSKNAKYKSFKSVGRPWRISDKNNTPNDRSSICVTTLLLFKPIFQLFCICIHPVGLGWGGGCCL